MTETGEVVYGLPSSGEPDVHDLIVSGQLEKALSTVSKGGGGRVSDGVRGENPLQKVPIPRLLKANTWSGFPIRKRRKWQGMDISIENPAGTYRAGTDPDGNEWRSLLYFDYGYIRGTIGVDKDHVDCFIGPNITDAKKVFVIHQKDVKTGKFDEDKVMLGWLKKSDAIKDYLKNYDRSDMMMGCTTMSIADFKKKVPKTNDKPMMIKAKIKAHPRKLKSGQIVNVREHTDSRHEALDREKNALLEKVAVLVAKKKRLYSDVDIESPMTPEEKKLNKEIAEIYSEINRLVRQKRRMKPVKNVVSKAKVRQHIRRTKSGKTTVVREHEDVRKKSWNAAGIGRYLNSKGLPIARLTRREKKSGFSAEKQGRQILLQYYDWEEKNNRDEMFRRAKTELNNTGMDITEIRPGVGIYVVHTLKAKGPMKKAKVKAHLRRSKSGKVSTVREHEDSRTKKGATHYDRVRDAWKRAYATIPKNTPSNEEPGKIFRALQSALKTEYASESPKGLFTEAQLKRALFGDGMGTAMDSWDYLSDIAIKKLGNDQELIKYGITVGTKVANITDHTAAIKNYKKSPGNQSLAARAAASYAAKHKEDMIAVPGDSYMQKVYHIYRASEAPRKVATLLGSIPIVLAKPNGDIFNAVVAKKKRKK